MSFFVRYNNTDRMVAAHGIPLCRSLVRILDLFAVYKELIAQVSFAAFCFRLKSQVCLV